MREIIAGVTVIVLVGIVILGVGLPPQPKQKVQVTTASTTPQRQELTTRQCDMMSYGSHGRLEVQGCDTRLAKTDNQLINVLPYRKGRKYILDLYVEGGYKTIREGTLVHFVFTDNTELTVSSHQPTNPERMAKVHMYRNGDLFEMLLQKRLKYVSIETGVHEQKVVGLSVDKEAALQFQNDWRQLSEYSPS